MRVNKYIIFAFIYFFINSVGLPFGLTYTALLSPLLYWWVTGRSGKEILLPFFAGLTVFAIFHFINGVDIKAYAISVLNYTAVYIFCHAFYRFLLDSHEPGKVFRFVLIGNFIFCLLALVMYFTPARNMLWMELDITQGVEDFHRLKLLTYEASYYALMFTPVFFYYFLQLVLGKNSMNSWLLLLMLLMPYLLSFSIGTLSAVLLSLVILLACYFRRLAPLPRTANLFLLFSSGLVVAGIVLFVFFPGNDLFLRILNIVTGEDSSGRGRTSEAFLLAGQILEQKSLLWGVGPGQVKLIGADIIRSYYLYDLDYNTIAIPNAVAETWAVFGWAGLVIRFIAEIGLFFYTKVWKNYYRFALFMFMFIYQFAGSFTTNISEYVMWIIAFTPVFSSFNVKQHVPVLQHSKLATI